MTSIISQGGSAGASAARSPLTAFGEEVVSQLTPLIQLANQHVIDPALREELEVFTATGGSADSNDNLWRCQTGTSVGGFGVIRSKDIIRYRAGQGVSARFTAKFTTGVPLSIQFGGIFSLTETCAVGYNGTDFSVLHDYNGHGEIKELQITTPAGGAETVTVTLDGVTTIGISVLGNSEQEDAKIIANALNADANQTGSWNIRQVDDKIIISARRTEDKTGAFTYSSTGSLVLTYTTTLEGQAKTENRIAQSSFNGDNVAWLDPTKLNVYQVQYGYLGGWGINYYVLNPTTGLWVLMHRIEWSNNQSVPLFGNPAMQIGYTAASLGSTTNLTVEGASMAAFLEGMEVIQGSSRAALNIRTSGTNTTLTNHLSARVRRTYGNKYNHGEVRLVSISVNNEHNKGLVVELFKDPTIDEGTTYQNWQYVDEVNSIVETDSNYGTVTLGALVTSFTVPANGSVTVDLEALEQYILPNELITAAIRTVSGTSTNETVVTLVWKEEK